MIEEITPSHIYNINNIQMKSWESTKLISRNTNTICIDFFNSIRSIY